jgi:hypothetical protein
MPKVTASGVESGIIMVEVMLGTLLIMVSK